MEREGGVVVERRLGLVDAVLSPSAALVICDNSAAKLVSRCVDAVRICSGKQQQLSDLNRHAGC